MAGGVETPNIAALPAIARLGICESARGPDADRHVKLLSQFAVEGSLSGAYSNLRHCPASQLRKQRMRKRSASGDLGPMPACGVALAAAATLVAGAVAGPRPRRCPRILEKGR
jgi:hypothetical protein